jgi:hypothetical protein
VHTADDDPLSSIFWTGTAPAEKALLQGVQAPAEPPSSSSSNCRADPRGSDPCGAQVQCTAGTARAPLLPPRASSSSLKRSTREGAARNVSCHDASSSFRSFALEWPWINHHLIVVARADSWRQGRRLRRAAAAGSGGRRRRRPAWCARSRC